MEFARMHDDLFWNMTKCDRSFLKIIVASLCAEGLDASLNEMLYMSNTRAMFKSAHAPPYAIILSGSHFLLVDDDRLGLYRLDPHIEPLTVTTLNLADPEIYAKLKKYLKPEDTDGL